MFRNLFSRTFLATNTSASPLLVRTTNATTTAYGSALQPIQQVRTRFQYLRHRTRVKRDMLRHECVAESELARRVLKALHRDQRLDMKTRLRAMLQLHAMPSYTRHTELKPRCVETGRAGGLIAPFRISRIVFREAIINGKMPGFIRARW